MLCASILHHQCQVFVVTDVVLRVGMFQAGSSGVQHQVGRTRVSTSVPADQAPGRPHPPTVTSCVAERALTNIAKDVPPRPMPSDPSDSARRTAHFHPIGHASHLQQQHPASPLSQSHRVSRRISSPSPPLIPARTPQERQHPSPFNSNQKKQTQTPKCQPSPPPYPTSPP